ncbi:MAG: FKBP-type peptidyl-prolyl cis-trans isomerase [Bacteroidota bacterium]|nr:FKBP-type peptidyl-prolyl cis-trans isomerase [Bacteroidota bacterium]MDP4205949.1 FKBP-type peptidyl-prolyl cis-trans isomerase [Bacteroidota bacterium]
MNKGFVFILILALVAAFSSCKKSASDEEAKLEKQIFANYIKKNNITVAPRVSGLYYIEEVAGTGDYPTYGDDVTMKYTGKLVANDSIFDSGTIKFRYLVSNMVAGVDEGLGLMKKGGKAKLLFLSGLGYGSTGSGSVPAYSSLLFEVEIVDIVKN